MGDIIGKGTGLARRVSGLLSSEPLSLIDVGCSGGLHWAFREFEPNLRALCFDPNISECKRLSSVEKNPLVKYISGFVGGDPNGELVKNRGNEPYLHRSPWGRLATSKSVEIRAQKMARKTNEQLTSENQWTKVELANPTKSLFLPDVLQAEGLPYLDVVKVDVDGCDFEILESLKEHFKKVEVLCIIMEVNWVGSECPTDHTFHNTDRFLRSHGFDLFNFDVRRYSLRALPGRYECPFPSQSEFGRPLQGDAVYARDLGDPAAQSPFKLTKEKVLKLAALFDMFGLPDHSAEVLITHREKVGPVEPLLDYLAESSTEEGKGGYDAYLKRFLADDPVFYPPPECKPRS